MGTYLALASDRVLIYDHVVAKKLMDEAGEKNPHCFPVSESRWKHGKLEHLELLESFIWLGGFGWGRAVEPG